MYNCRCTQLAFNMLVKTELCVYIHAHIHKCMWLYECKHVRVCIYVCVHKRTHTHVYAYLRFKAKGSTPHTYSMAQAAEHTRAVKWHLRTIKTWHQTNFKARSYSDRRAPQIPPRRRSTMLVCACMCVYMWDACKPLFICVFVCACICVGARQALLFILNVTDSLNDHI